MVVVKSRRAGAVVLFVVAFLALAGSRAFPFMDDLPGVIEAAVVLVGAMCALAGVYLWPRRSPGAKP
ncbi:hypothetical protein [Actinoplanes sp. URMC 104]|uniref:hypothetical protein n=1 Tax=Actinoplanes sp. URMC 104 TaxID=3423409 RepID=UPI003F1A8EE3